MKNTNTENDKEVGLASQMMTALDAMRPVLNPNDDARIEANLDFCLPDPATRRLWDAAPALLAFIKSRPHACEEYAVFDAGDESCELCTLVAKAEVK